MTQPKLTEEQRRQLLRQQTEEDQLAVNELQKAGIFVSSVHDLLADKNKLQRSIPVLLEILPDLSNAFIKESIVRSFGDKVAVGLVEEALFREFLAVPDDLFGGASLKWAIGNTLEIIATDKYADQLIKLATDKRHGTARQMIVVGLGRLKATPQVADVLIGLLDDEDLCGHAVMALGKLKVLRAVDKLKSLREHPKRWIRTEVNKALKRIGAVGH